MLTSKLIIGFQRYFTKQYLKQTYLQQNIYTENICRRREIVLINLIIQRQSLL